MKVKITKEIVQQSIGLIAINGPYSRPRCCPIALAIKQQMNLDPYTSYVSVSQLETRITIRDKTTTYDMSKEATDFIKSFDSFPVDVLNSSLLPVELELKVRE